MVLSTEVPFFLQAVAALIGPPVSLDFGETGMETEVIPPPDAHPQPEAAEQMDVDFGEGFFEGRDLEEMPPVRKMGKSLVCLSPG